MKILTRPNIGLQRTAPCGLAAEAGSFGGSRTVSGASFLAVLLVLPVISACATAKWTDEKERSLRSWCKSDEHVLSFGELHLHGFAGRLEDRSGPIVDANIRLQRIGDLTVNSNGWETTSSMPDGRFFISDMPEGGYEVEICAAQHKPLHGVVVIDEALPVMSAILWMEGPGNER